MNLPATSSKLLFDAIAQQLSALYPLEESKAIAFWLLESRLHLRKPQILSDKALTAEQQEQLALVEKDVKRLLHHEPLQYILGETEFAGLRLKVSSAVLIPRPETEELIAMIVQEHQNVKGLRALDIGTGSGCIALGMAAGLKEAAVWAMDVSEAALAVARENAARNQLEVNFLQADVLSLQPEELHGQFDIIVSNPPYITESEKSLMRENVLAHEPHLALFVADHEPLLFYKAIAQLGQQKLVPGGKLYFEINEAYGKETAVMLEEKGYQAVEVIKDMFGKDRMIRCRR